MIGGSEFMKKVLVCIVGVFCLGAAVVLAADKPAAPAGRSPVLKTNSVKAAKMNARGKVVEISETAVKIERIIKGNAEIVEFALEYPARAVAVNDFVKIDYTVQEGKLTAVRVAKLGAPKATGKSTVKPAAEKPTVVTQ
jgi:hypothetical protein